MTKAFIEKRIIEQELYLKRLAYSLFDNKITVCRYLQVKKSAQGVLVYFVYKLARYEFDELTEPIK